MTITAIGLLVLMLILAIVEYRQTDRDSSPEVVRLRILMATQVATIFGLLGRLLGAF
jgi:hypothetical protein